MARTEQRMALEWSVQIREVSSAHPRSFPPKNTSVDTLWSDTLCFRSLVDQMAWFLAFHSERTEGRGMISHFLLLLDTLLPQVHHSLTTIQLHRPWAVHSVYTIRTQQWTSRESPTVRCTHQVHREKRVRFLERIGQSLDRRREGRGRAVRGKHPVLECRVASKDVECTEWSGRHGKPVQPGSLENSAVRRLVSEWILWRLSRSSTRLLVVECCPVCNHSSWPSTERCGCTLCTHVSDTVLSAAQKLSSMSWSLPLCTKLVELVPHWKRFFLDLSFSFRTTFRIFFFIQLFQL